MNGRSLLSRRTRARLLLLGPQECWIRLLLLDWQSSGITFWHDKSTDFHADLESPVSAAGRLLLLSIRIKLCTCPETLPFLNPALDISTGNRFENRLELNADRSPLPGAAVKTKNPEVLIIIQTFSAWIKMIKSPILLPPFGSQTCWKIPRIKFWLVNEYETAVLTCASNLLCNHNCISLKRFWPEKNSNIQLCATHFLLSSRKHHCDFFQGQSLSFMRPFLINYFFINIKVKLVDKKQTIPDPVALSQLKSFDGYQPWCLNETSTSWGSVPLNTSCWRATALYLWFVISDSIQSELDGTPVWSIQAPKIL